VIIECSHCRAKYQYDEARFDGKVSKKIRCAKCQKVFEIRNPVTPTAPAVAPSAAAAPPATPRPVPPPPREDVLEATRTRRRTREELLDLPVEPEHDTGKVEPGGMELPRGFRLSVAVINGPDAGMVHRMSKPRIVIGRSNCDLVLDDTEVSRAHAAIEIRDTQYLLEDLGSTNGTLIDGERITGLVELQNHSEFQVGTSTLMLIVTEEG
jgi:predicted Zn finger-like uncharacterized protein